MKGSCLCKRIKYECDRLQSEIVYCHCQTCQKAHAAPYTPTASVLRTHFRWLSGEDELAFFESSPGKKRHFCANCGTHLMAEWQDRDTVILRLATLDSDPPLTDSFHIWCSEDKNWCLGDKERPHYAAWQPGR